MWPPAPTPLKWLERTLFVAGVVLGLWAIVLFAQSWYYARLPIPEQARTVTATQLPGEDPNEAVGTSGFIERGAWLARLEAPSVKLTATVLEGSDDRTLRRAAGHIEYTPRPGTHGNVGIAGHRDTTFYPVRNLEVGDPLTLTTVDRVYDYRVTRTWIVNPEQVEVLAPTDRPTLTLVTCYPFNFIGTAPKRFIVRAELTSERQRP